MIRLDPPIASASKTTTRWVAYYLRRCRCPSGGRSVPDLEQRLRTVLANHYRIERPLGRGDVATVFLAEELKHRRRVAIKVMDSDLAAAIGPPRFRREIETAAGLRHPHILPLHDSREAEEVLFHATSYVAGGVAPGATRPREKQLPVEVALQIACEVAEAPDFTHRRGVVHRDIEPENVLLE